MPLKTTLLVALLLPPLLILSLGSVFSQKFKDKPRNKIDYDKCGHYELVPQLQKAELDPGDTLKIDLYFSGYGQIRGSKVYFSTVDSLFDTTSYTKFDLNKHDSTLYWGYTTKTLITPSRFEFSLTGMDNKSSKSWGLPTEYVDYPSDDSTKVDSTDFAILTEVDMENPPFSIRLHTKKSAPPGNYVAEIVYTYFNGQEWQGQTQVINYKINNKFEQYPIWTWVIGFVVAVIAVIPTIVGFAKFLSVWTPQNAIFLGKTPILIHRWLK